MFDWTPLLSLTDDEWEEIRRVLTSRFGENAALCLGDKLKVKYDSFLDPATKERVFIQPYVMHKVSVSVVRYNDFADTTRRHEREEWFAKLYEAGTDTIRFVYIEGARSYLERRINPIDPSTGQRLFAPSRLYV